MAFRDPVDAGQAIARASWPYEDVTPGRQMDVEIPVGDGQHVNGTLALPEAPARGLVLFAHGSGSSRSSPRNQQVAAVLVQSGMATLLMDLLTPAEERDDARTGMWRFAVELLAERVEAATEWVVTQPALARLAIGYFGASTGAAAAFIAAADLPSRIGAVVSRGGRSDLAGEALVYVQAATLLIVGSEDASVIEVNEEALQLLRTPHKELRLVPGATHLFQEAGALQAVARLARDWFDGFLMPASQAWAPAPAG